MTAWYDMALSPCVKVSVEAKILARQDYSGAGVKGGVFRLAVVPLDAVEAPGGGKDPADAKGANSGESRVWNSAITLGGEP